MTDAALLSTSTEYLPSESNKSINFTAEASSDEEEEQDVTTTTITKSSTAMYHHHKSNVTALTLPEPLRASNEDIDKQAAIAANALSNAALSHKLNSGIMYRDYISDSSDINSETSSLFEEGGQQHHHQFRQSTGDLTLISKAVSIDTHTSDTPGSSAIVPAERNPVSDLLRSPSSVISTDGEDSPAVAVEKIKSKRHSVPDLAMSEYYASSATATASVTASTADAIMRKSIKKKLAVSTSLASMSRHRKQVAATTPADLLPSHPLPQRAIASNEEPPPPPTPTSHSALKKNAVHYDRKIIPDHPSFQQQQQQQQLDIARSEQREPTALDTNTTTAIPNGQQPRFITMEEELESAEDLFISADDQESIELSKPHNMSMVDLTQQHRQETTKKNEIRSLEQRRSIKRLNAVKELMETEETYSRDLGILCTVSCCQ